MALIPVRANLPADQSQKQGAWFVHAALQRYAQDVPEAASNTYYQEAMQESAAAYQVAMK